MSPQQFEPQTISHAHWLELIDQFTETDAGSGIKRKDNRRHASLIATVTAEDTKGRQRKLLANLMQLSSNGCMLKTDIELQAMAPVTLECGFDDDEVILLHGKVVHSTSTIGGYKTGIRLHFE